MSINSSMQDYIVFFSKEVLKKEASIFMLFILFTVRTATEAAWFKLIRPYLKTLVLIWISNQHHIAQQTTLCIKQT